MKNAPYEINYENRKTSQSVDPLFLQRWSPRSFKKVDISDEEVRTIFEAARWSPSSYNAQPWRFVISNNNQEFDQFLDLVLESNQIWAKNSSRIGFIFSQNQFEHNQKENPWAQFDAGSAWMSFTLQANILGYQTHGLAGIKYEDIYEKFEVSSDEYKLICGFALGKMDIPDQLPEELKSREQPSVRKPLSETLGFGKFPR